MQAKTVCVRPVFRRNLFGKRLRVVWQPTIMHGVHNYASSGSRSIYSMHEGGKGFTSVTGYSPLSMSADGIAWCQLEGRKRSPRHIECRGTARRQVLRTSDFFFPVFYPDLTVGASSCRPSGPKSKYPSS